jgi:hypothetical protein
MLNGFNLVARGGIMKKIFIVLLIFCFTILLQSFVFKASSLSRTDVFNATNTFNYNGSENWDDSNGLFNTSYAMNKNSSGNYIRNQNLSIVLETEPMVTFITHGLGSARASGSDGTNGSVIVNGTTGLNGQNG